ncbi:MAG: secretin N-terminal domain-containing protein [Planctomycetota bacterium]
MTSLIWSLVAIESGAQPNDEVVLDLREPITLQALVDYTSREFGINLLYEPGVVSGSVRLQTQGPIPRDALWGILNASMQLHGYVIADLDVPGFKQITQIENVKPAIRRFRADGADDGRPATADELVVEAVKLTDLQPSAAVRLVAPVLTSQANVVFTAEEQRTILLADERSRVEQAVALIQLVEGAKGDSNIRTLTLRHALVQDVANTVLEVMSAKLQGDGLFRQIEGLRVLPDVRTNQIVITAADPRLLDDAVRLATLLDTEVTSPVPPVRRYKLTNTTAVDLLRTLKAVSGGDADPFDELGAAEPGLAFGGREETTDSGGELGQNGGRGPNSFGEGRAATLTVETSFSEGQLNGADVTLAADVNTNSIIVVADPATQEIYAGLIELLDERRPQVQIEATLVSLNTTNDYTLGVEFGIDAGLEGDAQLITFSSFGISTIDPLTAGLTPTVASGLTSALLDADFAEVVLRAFEEDGNSRVLSAPTLLVNDNERGRLRSLTEEPTTSITQGEVSDQISFREYVEAGTTIDVVPHISEGGYLQLEYRVEVNSFLPADATLAALGVPPPRQTDALQSRVTIPDGFTIIVGGLTRRDESEIISKVPILGDVPLLGELFKQTSRDSNKSTLFVFLRPTILADDDFADLRGLSETKLRDAGLPGNEPYDEPDLILGE